MKLFTYLFEGVLFITLGLAFSMTTALSQDPVKDVPPETRYSPVTDVYHDVEVIDGYRWLEDWSDPQVRSWSDVQNAYARSVLDNLPSVVGSFR